MISKELLIESKRKERIHFENKITKEIANCTETFYTLDANILGSETLEEPVVMIFSGHFCQIWAITQVFSETALND